MGDLQERLEREKQENARIRKKEKASEENFQNSIVQLGKFQKVLEQMECRVSEMEALKQKAMKERD